MYNKKILFTPVFAADEYFTNIGLKVKRNVKEQFVSFNKLRIFHVFQHDKGEQMFPHIRQYMNENDGELSIYVPVHLDGFYKDEFKVDVILDNIKERWTTLSKDILKRIFEISLDHHLLNLNNISRTNKEINDIINKKNRTCAFVFNVLPSAYMIWVIAQKHNMSRKRLIVNTRRKLVFSPARRVIHHELGHVAHCFHDMFSSSSSGNIKEESYSMMLQRACLKDKYSSNVKNSIIYDLGHKKPIGDKLCKYLDGNIKSWLYNFKKSKMLGLGGLTRKRLMDHYTKANENSHIRSPSSIVYYGYCDKKARRMLYIPSAGWQKTVDSDDARSPNYGYCISSERWQSKTSKLYHAGNIKDVRHIAKMIFYCTSFSYRKSFIIARELAKGQGRYKRKRIIRRSSR